MQIQFSVVLNNSQSKAKHLKPERYDNNPSNLLAISHHIELNINRDAVAMVRLRHILETLFMQWKITEAYNRTIHIL